eukprot:2598500-Pyramimonas_sp.AAC.2
MPERTKPFIPVDQGVGMIGVPGLKMAYDSLAKSSFSSEAIRLGGKRCVGVVDVPVKGNKDAKKQDMLWVTR